ncbi:MAG: carbohydrate ABC transporter permease [Spirochaetaceae bacterium]|nr:MAG: carbohydrate ABC transporter permease [Spirochaetaceae bacterium]
MRNIYLVFFDPEQHRALGFRPYLNSLIIALGTSLITAAISFFAGFGFARYRFRGREILLLSLLFINMLPLMARVIPLFRMFILYRLYDTYIGLILLHAASQAPFATWLMRGYIWSIPKDLEDSAMIDGCTRGKAVRRIIAPLSAPGLAAVAVLSFRYAWNEFTAALILTTSESMRPYTVAIHKFVGDHSKIDWHLISAASFISIIPIIIAFAFFQRYFVSGLTRGAVKD